MKAGRVTYTEGPVLRFKRLLDESMYVMIANELSAAFTLEFGPKFGDNDYRFEPEPITEGGFVMTHFPGKTGEMYKSLRHHLRNPKTMRQITWPYVPDNVMDAWELSDREITSAGAMADTTLKAFYGAPLWTIAELRLIQKVFARFGINCTHFPSKKSLSSPGSQWTL